jgi:hypothetical protein
MAEAKKPGLTTKMALAMGEIGRVPKRGHNQAQNYAYARADDVAEHAREVLAKLGIAVFPDVLDYGTREIEAKSGKMRITWAKVAWHFVDSESGEERIVNVPGEGQDYGDKGLYKAMTGSLKYVLMTSFLIPTGEGDPEFEKAEETTTVAPRKRDPEAAKKAADAMRAKINDPSARLEAVKAWAMKTHAASAAKAKAAIEQTLGRTLATHPIEMAGEGKGWGITADELQRLEAWVEIAKAGHAAQVTS